MDIADYIKQRRSELRLTQGDVGEAMTSMGVPTTDKVVSHWETKRNKPHLDNQRFREALAFALQVNVDTMLKTLGYVDSISGKTNEAYIAAKIIDKLPNEARELAMDYLQLLEKRFANTGG